MCFIRGKFVEEVIDTSTNVAETITNYKQQTRNKKTKSSLFRLQPQDENQVQNKTLPKFKSKNTLQLEITKHKKLRILHQNIDSLKHKTKTRSSPL